MKNKFFYKKQFTNIYKKQSKLSETTSQVLYGEKFEILSKNINWLKIKTSFDNYVGYIYNKQYIKEINSNYKVCNLKAKIFKRPNVKTKSYLPFGSILLSIDQNRNFIKIQKNKWIKKKDIKLKNNKSIIKKLIDSKKVRKKIIKLKQDINKPDFGRI